MVLHTISQASLCTGRSRAVDITLVDSTTSANCTGCVQEKPSCTPGSSTPPGDVDVEAYWESKCLVGRDFLGAVAH